MGRITASVYAFSASRYARTSGFARSLSQNQSSTRSSPWARSTLGILGAMGATLDSGMAAESRAATLPRMAAAPVTTPLPFTEAELDAVKYDPAGLVAAIVQEQATGDVLMIGWMNREALRRTLETGRTWFWSRSRQEFWCKGESSGDRQYVRRAAYDCDMDALLFVVEQEGRGACHTGERSCFFREFGSGAVPGPV